MNSHFPLWISLLKFCICCNMYVSTVFSGEVFRGSGPTNSHQQQPSTINGDMVLRQKIPLHQFQPARSSHTLRCAHPMSALQHAPSALPVPMNMVVHSILPAGGPLHAPVYFIHPQSYFPLLTPEVHGHLLNPKYQVYLLKTAIFPPSKDSVQL